MASFAALPLAAAGQVGEGFFRNHETSPCQAKPSHLFCWDWARENIDRYGTPTLQQLELGLISVVLGFAVAFPLALLAHRRHWLRPPLLAGTGILYAIPSISFFLLLLPITGRSRLTAIIALSAYTLQIIYRNVTVGLDNVPKSAKDSARGMGMTDRQILWRVELPLAMPEIIGGLHDRDRDPRSVRRRRRPRHPDPRRSEPAISDHDPDRDRDRGRDGVPLRRRPAHHPVPLHAMATSPRCIVIAAPVLASFGGAIEFIFTPQTSNVTGGNTVGGIDQVIELTFAQLEVTVLALLLALLIALPAGLYFGHG